MSHALIRPALLLALCSACTDDGASGGGVTGTTHVESYVLPARAAPQLDLLFVVDDTTAMAGHQAALAGVPAAVDQLFGSAGEYVGSYHLGVVTTDLAGGGSLRGSSAFSGAFIEHDNTWSTPASNYQGSLADALASVWPSSATSTAATQPLATARAALDGNAANTGFLRASAYLGIITITASDDASAATPAEYASAAKATKTDPAAIVASGVFPPGAPRLAAFHAQFPNRSAVSSIDDADYASALAIFPQLYRTVLGYPCTKEPADLDPDAPGAQYDCSFVWLDGGVEHRLPACAAGVTSPCWEFATADPGCSESTQNARLQTRHFTPSTSGWGDPYHPEVRGQCIVN